MCENLFLFVYRGKKRSEKYTLIHQCFFRRTGTRVHNSIFFFSFYSMHFRIVYICYKKRTIFTIFKNNVIRKRKKKSAERCKMRWMDHHPLVNNILYFLPHPKTIWLLFYWLKKTHPSLSDITDRGLLCVPGL